ncbi:MAG: hypothetical protein UH963_12265 [Agathobacter sp.]|nr:hypothetical protein [Agathobacter sp.]
MRKKLITVLLLLSMAATGCSNGAANDTDSSKDVKESSQTDSSADEGDSASDETSADDAASANDEDDTTNAKESSSLAGILKYTSSGEITNDFPDEAINLSYKADLTDDGADDTIDLTISPKTDSGDDNVIVSVKSNDKEIYKKTMPVHSNLGEILFLTKVDGKSYLMEYIPQLAHSSATCSYKVFNLSSEGKENVLDSDSIEASFVSKESFDLDKTKWISFADKENQYFQNAFLLADTLYDLSYSKDSSCDITYEETFDWLSTTKTGNIDSNLDNLIQEVDSLSE